MTKAIVLGMVGVFLAAAQAGAASKFVDGDVIVQLAPGKRANFRSAQVEIVEALVPSIGIYLAKAKKGQTTLSAINGLRQARTAGLIAAQPNHFVSRRADVVMPNDPEFTRLWSLHSATGVDINAPEAWAMFADPASSGSEAVVAVVDGGMDRNHPDLKPNLWTNAGEIAGNNLDDDGNGYVDDINGWDAFGSNGNPPSDMHGTHVGGIVAAKGNNSSFVVGVNWNTKLMVVNGATDNTAVVLRAYNYVLTQKKLWISSNGAKGANVVATNSSFGVDYGDCAADDFPMWDAVYTEMGNAGILSAAATANLNIDVDVSGDVPTGCTSNSIIAVTNTDNRDLRNARAAYGLTSVDLGAPGTAIVSTLPNGKTGPLTGTSMATPHVAGAVAFMHSVASPAFKTLYASNPGLAASELKRLLLTNGVDLIPSMAGKTVSGGRLNLLKAGLAISTYAPVAQQ